MSETMYPESDRKIFQYSPGPDLGPCAADPLYVLRQYVIEFKGRSLREVVYEEWTTEAPLPKEGMTDEEKELIRQDKAWIELRAARAEQLLVEATRKIFDMQPFDKKTGRGATDKHVLGVITDFLKFLV